MVVTRLAFEGFRNLRDGEVSPCPGVNVVYGDNAQGKTNLLEGLWLFTGGHSFRGAKDAELPRLDPKTGENAPAAALALDFFSEGRDQKAILRLENGRRSSVINGVKKKTGSALVGKVCAVIFSPEHLLLVKEGPARRRGFLDGALCQLRPSYAGMLHVYQRALAQRNALLKDIVRFPELHDTLSVWDARLAKLGVAVMEERRRYVEQVAPKAQEAYEGISRGREDLSLTYAPVSYTHLDVYKRQRSIWARREWTAGPLPRFSIRLWMVQASAARPISPPKASISRTKWPLAVPPMLGLHGQLPTASKLMVKTMVEQPRRAAAKPASIPAWPAPTTATS